MYDLKRVPRDKVTLHIPVQIFTLLYIVIIITLAFGNAFPPKAVHYIKMERTSKVL